MDVSVDTENLKDTEHIRRAIELAESVRGTTSPNPWVGCIVVPAGDHALTLRGDDRSTRGAPR